MAACVDKLYISTMKAYCIKSKFDKIFSFSISTWPVFSEVKSRTNFCSLRILVNCMEMINFDISGVTAPKYSFLGFSLH